MALKPRTGNQYVISSGEWSAVVTELGASLRELKWRGEDLIVPFDPNKVIPCCNGWVLAPYPNRVTNGQYSFDGEDYQMPIDEFDRQSSLHGYAYRYMWELVDLQESHVTLSWRSPDIAGYPFDITITATYALDESGLTETFTVHNNDSVKAPWAFGIHPWLANGKQGATAAERDADSAACHLQIKAASHVTVNEALIPTGTEPVTGIYDLNDGPTLEGRAFDDAWVDVERAADGTTTTTFTRPDGIEVKIIGDETINAWQCYTATGAPFAEHPYGIAVEPMTAPANAFRTGDHLVTLAPNGDYTTVVRYEVVQK